MLERSPLNLLARPPGRVALAIGLSAACAFIGLSRINLSGQGLYYDEIHQAPAAFAYLGRSPQLFAMAFVQGKPLMTMSYSGAIKSGLYGLYLRVSGASFAVESWRWLGIATVALTLPLFSVLARRRLSIVGLLVFFGLLLTDTTVILGTRHDWGPMAMALALRMILLGTWLYGQVDGAVRARNSFCLGLLVGFSIYEKLSNVVLLPPLGILLLCRKRRTVKHWCVCLAGGLVGGSLLLYANYLIFSQRGRLLSTSQVATQGTKTLAGLSHLLREYLALGDGALVRRFILGNDHGYERAEGLLLGIALIAVLGLWKAGSMSRMPSILVACYTAVVAGLFLLPNETGAHHWVIGTPFQYLAIAMAIGGPEHPPIRLPRLAVVSRAALVGVVGVLILVRAHGTLDLARALARGDSSETWAPSLTRLGELGAQRAGHDLFVAGNWGVATQMYCLSNGHPSMVRELLQWPTVPPLEKVLDLDRYSSFYLVLKVPHTFPDPVVTRRLITAFEEHPNLREIPAEPSLTHLAGVKVRRFVRSDVKGIAHRANRSATGNSSHGGLFYEKETLNR